jgi:hypothetical protein
MIAIDWKNPIQLSGILMISVFLFSTIVLSIFPPSWVKTVNVTTGHEYIRWQMVILYSAIFGITVGICSLLISTKLRGQIEPMPTRYANEQP